MSGLCGCAMLTCVVVLLTCSWRVYACGPYLEGTVDLTYLVALLTYSRRRTQRVAFCVPFDANGCVSDAHTWGLRQRRSGATRQRQAGSRAPSGTEQLSYGVPWLDVASGKDSERAFVRVCFSERVCVCASRESGSASGGIAAFSVLSLSAGCGSDLHRRWEHAARDDSSRFARV
eukprot:3409887-Rhodomonas_salina.1